MRAGVTNPKKYLAMLALETSPALYILSFFFPVFHGPSHPLPGWAAFMLTLLVPLYFSFASLVTMHPAGLICLAIFPSWLANVVYWRTIYRLRTGRRRGVVARGVLAVVLGLSVLPVVIWWESSPPGTSGLHHVLPREGYWLWLGSMALLAFGGWVHNGDRRDEVKTEKLARSWDD